MYVCKSTCYRSEGSESEDGESDSADDSSEGTIYIYIYMRCHVKLVFMPSPDSMASYHYRLI